MMQLARKRRIKVSICDGNDELFDPEYLVTICSYIVIANIIPLFHCILVVN
jgi:hypothetical protein